MPYDVFFDQIEAPTVERGEGSDIGLPELEIDPKSPRLQLLRKDLLEDIRAGKVGELNDLDASQLLIELCQTELERFGTESNEILNDQEIALVIRSLHAVLLRLGMELELPFRNFTTFLDHWKTEGAVGPGSWSKRRVLLEKAFTPVRSELDKLDFGRITKPLANPVGIQQDLWPKVDQEIRELRRKFSQAVTPQDFRALGTNFIGVMEAIGEAVHDPAHDLRESEKQIPKDRPKIRIERFLERAIKDEHKLVKKQVRSTLELAHKVKHSESSGSLMTGVAADSVVLLASIIRRIGDPSFEATLDDEAPF